MLYLARSLSQYLFLLMKVKTSPAPIEEEDLWYVAIPIPSYEGQDGEWTHNLLPTFGWSQYLFLLMKVKT